MSTEFLDSPESSEPSHLEFYLVMSALRAKFEQARQEQLETRRYDMFTLMRLQSGAFARIRIADHALAHESLQAIAVPDEHYFDVAMPIKGVDPDNPELAEGKEGQRFILFGGAGDVETQKLIEVHNARDFFEAHPDFMGQSLAYEPVPIRKIRES